MKIILILSLLISSQAMAANKRMAMIKNGVVINIALWDGASSWHPSGVSLVDVTSNRAVDIGSTCSKCDGSDFVPPMVND